MRNLAVVSCVCKDSTWVVRDVFYTYELMVLARMSDAEQSLLYAVEPVLRGNKWVLKSIQNHFPYARTRAKFSEAVFKYCWISGPTTMPIGLLEAVRRDKNKKYRCPPYLQTLWKHHDQTARSLMSTSDQRYLNVPAGEARMKLSQAFGTLKGLRKAAKLRNLRKLKKAHVRSLANAAWQRRRDLRL